ncbi:ftsH, partial [Symbiodinium microadriaticum]
PSSQHRRQQRGFDDPRGDYLHVFRLKYHLCTGCQLHMAAAGGSAAVMGAVARCLVGECKRWEVRVAALGPRRAAAKRSRQAVATRAAKQARCDSVKLVRRPGPQQLSLLVQQLQAFASAELRRGAALSAPAARAFEEVVQSANEALVSSADKQPLGRAYIDSWSDIGPDLQNRLTFSVTLQPAFAADVNYSDFMESVNRGDVEMVRVQDDQLSAQYTTKDGARKEVNLIPNAQHLVRGGTDFLARFAGPIAWLIAGLLFLFGGLPEGSGVVSQGDVHRRTEEDDLKLDGATTCSSRYLELLGVLNGKEPAWEGQPAPAAQVAALVAHFEATPFIQIEAVNAPCYIGGSRVTSICDPCWELMTFLTEVKFADVAGCDGAKQDTALFEGSDFDTIVQ